MFRIHLLLFITLCQKLEVRLTYEYSSSEEIPDSGTSVSPEENTLIPTDKEMIKYTEEEVTNVIRDCDVSRELLCIEVDSGCLGLQSSDDMPPEENRNYEKNLQSFKETCFGALWIYGSEIGITSAFEPPKKDNYFIGFAISPHYISDPSLPSDVILFGVRRPVAGSSSLDDQIFYGYIPNVREKPKRKVYDIEFMYNYFGNKISSVFPSATYKNAPLNHKWRLWKGSRVLQWVSTDKGNSSFDYSKNDTEAIRSKWKGLGLEENSIRKISITGTNYYIMFLQGYTTGDVRESKELEILRDGLALSLERLPLVLTATTLQSIDPAALPLFLPNGTQVCQSLEFCQDSVFRNGF